MNEFTPAGDHARYLPAPTPDCPTYDGDSEWHPLVDGAAYLPELSALLDRLAPGDGVTVAGLELDPELDLDGHEPGDAAYRPLGERLARLAADGVDVRVLLASRAFASSVPGTLLGGFRSTAQHAERLRGLLVGGSCPLAGRVLLDFSGALLGSNHQKAVVGHAGGEVIAFVGGIDLVTDRFDAAPHDRLTLRSQRWGWHDAAVRLRGPAAARVWNVLGARWADARTLPPRRRIAGPGRLAWLNPGDAVPAPGPAPHQQPVASPGVQVRVLRSVFPDKIESKWPGRTHHWQAQPAGGVREIYETLRHAIDAARLYVYVEDQYLEEALGGTRGYALLPLVRDAAARGVRVILVGSGTRDPEDTGVHLRAINREPNRDVRRSLLDGLSPATRDNVAQLRIANLTVHSKVVLVDDVFACIGSANFFSRSMIGVDCELSTAVATSTPLVRELRVTLWAEHLRAPLSAGLRAALQDPGTALGMWRPEWSDDPLRFRTPDDPPGFRPAERVLHLVGP